MTILSDLIKNSRLAHNSTEEGSQLQTPSMAHQALLQNLHLSVPRCYLWEISSFPSCIQGLLERIQGQERNGEMG